MTSDTVWIGGEPAQMNVVNEILAERIGQDEKWGEQNNPVHWSPSPRIEAFQAVCFKNEADHWKTVNGSRAKSSRAEVSWDGILLEEVFEALAETDPVKQREELVQVAAVAVAMIECLDRAATS